MMYLLSDSSFPHQEILPGSIGNNSSNFGSSAWSTYHLEPDLWSILHGPIYFILPFKSIISTISIKIIALLALHRFSREQKYPNIDILLVFMVNELRKYPHTIYILSVSFNEQQSKGISKPRISHKTHFPKYYSRSGYIERANYPEIFPLILDYYTFCGYLLRI